MIHTTKINTDLSYSTKGMPSWAREELINKIGLIPIGTKCWKSGGAWDVVSPVVVTEDNQEIISLSWNSFYFLKYEDAEQHTNMSHGKYGSYLNSIHM